MLNNYYITQFVIYCGPSLQEASFTYDPLLEMLAMFGAKIIGNLCSESRKRHSEDPKIQNFPGAHAPGPP